MTDVVIAGIGQIPVGEHWELSLRQMGVRAIRAAIADSGGLKPQALYIGNMLASVVSHQANLGSLFADYAALRGIESYTVEAAGASGGGALRMAYLAILSGYIDTALVLGVEKWTDQVGRELQNAAAMEMDYDYEAVPGLTVTAQAGMLMQRYLHTYNLPANALAGFPIQAHANAVNNPNAYFKRALDQQTYDSAEMVSDPLNMYDASPMADGAAALLLTRRDLLPADFKHKPVRVLGSSVSIDTLALHDRKDALAFDAAKYSVEGACRQAGIMPIYADLFEVDDSFSIYAALSLEASGFAEKGQASELTKSGILHPKGKLPILTMGGCKARGNPIGAKGVYQAVEAVLQLRGEAGANQVPDARVALIQCLGGPASTAIAHVLERAGDQAISK
jgi:acetyl-CoA C-acetyltransferase